MNDRSRYDPRSARGWLIDLDGVLYEGDRRLEGSARFISTLQERRLPYLCVTNNSSRTPAQVSAKLQALGVPVDEAHVFTSSVATASYLKEHLPAGARVLVVGEEGLAQAMTAAGYSLAAAPSADGATIDAVIVGIDRQVTYALLRSAALAIRRGAQFIGTNPDATLPSEAGLVPGAGAILSFLQTATDISPTVIGKPSAEIFQQALQLLGVERAGSVALGDRLNTDIQGGRNAGLQTILVLTGVTRRDELQASPLQPDLVVENLPDLLKLLG